jgi:hypothetical protein
MDEHKRINNGHNFGERFFVFAKCPQNDNNYFNFILINLSEGVNESNR